MDFPSTGSVNVSTSSLGNELRQVLEADDLKPGDEPSYQLCKALYIYHTLGAKMAETPIRLAQSQERKITVPDSPEEEVVEAWMDQWEALEASDAILNVMTQARVYGATTIIMGTEKGDLEKPVDLKDLWKDEVYFNVLDPLNTAGSLVTNQDPNSPLFQKWKQIEVQGQKYHRSRTCTMLNERSLYIAWSSSAYGYVGRSVYQRAFFPMKSFLWTMITDEMVARKAGLIVARLEQPGSIVDRMWKAMAGLKRSILKQARSDNVISIGVNEMLETLNMRNVPDSMSMAREDIIKNIATAADMPAKLLTQEAFVQGFGEGTQDAYAVAQYIDRQRIEMNRIYKWFDTICMYRAWTPEFYETIQRRFPKEYSDVAYETAFYRWKNAFRANWPSLIKEKPSEEVEVEDVKLKGMIAIVQVLAPMLDPDNRAELVQWMADQINTNEVMFGGATLNFDPSSLMDFMDQQQEQQAMMAGGGEGGLEQQENDEPAPPESGRDSNRPRAGQVSRLADVMLKRQLALA